MSGRCTCCNRILLRPTGTRTLSDGSKIEETFCTVCRNEVNRIMYDDSVSSFKQFEGILDQQLCYGTITPQRNPSY